MKKLLSFIMLTAVILSVSSCAEGQNDPATGTINADTTSSAAGAPETSADLTVTHTEVPFETTTSAAYTISDGIVSMTTEGYTEPVNPLTTTSTTKSPATSDETGVYVTGYDPGLPEAWIDIQTREIYNDTKEIKITVNCSQESTLGGGFNLERKTDKGWISVFSCNVDCLGTITPDDPFILTLTPDELVAGDDYRISTTVNGKEIETFFVVGQRTPPLKREDISLYLADTDWLTEDNLHDLTIKYTYVGNADYADYGFGCEYTLEKRNDKGEWVKIPFSENAGFIALGYLIGTESPNQSTTVYLSNDFYAEPLTAGTYRIVKPVENITYTLLFRINEKYNYEPEPSEKDIKISIKEVTENTPITTNTEKITLNIDYIGTDDFATFGYGEFTAVEKYENGKWTALTIKDGFGWDDVLYIVGHENRNSNINVYLNCFTEPLAEGKYRIKKTFSGTKDLYAEFDVKNADLFTVDFVDGVQMEITTDDKWIDVEVTYNGSEEDFEYEFNMASYYIERLEANGKWKRYYFRDDIDFCDGIDLILPDQRSFTRRIDLGDSYTEPVIPGTYRAVIMSYQSVDAVFGFVVVEADDGHKKFDDLKITLANDKIEEKTKFKALVVQYEYTGNDPDADFWIYNDFEVQKLDDEGRWQPYPFSKKVRFSEDVIRLDSKNARASETLKLNDEYFKEPLTAGNYRIVKPMCDCTNKYIEFQVTGLGTPQGSGSITLTIDNITENSFICSLPWPYPATYTVEITDTDLLDEYCIGDNIEVVYGNMYQQSEWDYFIVDAKISHSDFQLEEGADYKPVIYLYPEEKTDVSVKLDYNGELTVTYPEYGDGWNVTAMPDGTLYDKNGNEYSYLFWEGKSNIQYDFSKGFCVKGKDTAEFLRWALSTLGLTPREYNEFIVFWLPFMQDNEYNIISFQYDCYTDNAILSVTPDPDTILRVFMAFCPSDEYIEIPEQELITTERNGFTVVEWGGTKTKRIG